MVDVAAEPERRGPAERRRNPRDRRAHDLTITEAGRNVFARLKTTEAEDDTFAPLSAAERRRLREHLAQLLGPGSSAAKGGGSPRIVPSRPVAVPAPNDAPVPSLLGRGGRRVARLDWRRFDRPPSHQEVFAPVESAPTIATTTADGLAPVAPLRPTDAVDLHLHTLASDGFWTPAALIDRLVGEGITVAAVCDHDTQRSVLEATRRGAKRGVRIVPGVEVTTRWRDRQWHLLVYGIRPDRTDDTAAAFRAVMAELDARLMATAEDSRQRIEASGRALPSLEEVTAGRPLWPFQVLSSVIREGHGKDLKTAAELVTALGGSFTADLPLGRVVEAAHGAGGLCVVAHPGRSDSVGVMLEADLDAMLAEVPIDGLEAHYRSYTDEQTRLYRDLAAARGLLVSCGSDSHAPKQPVDPRPWRAAWCADLLGRLGVAVEPVADGEPVWAPGMDPLAAPPTPPEAPKDAGQEESAGEQIMEAETAIEAGREGAAAKASGS